MAFWARIKAALGGNSTTGEVALEGDRVVLRDLARARTFQQEPANTGLKSMRTCEKCSGTLQQVVFTTAGGGEQLKIWKAYPLAIDGWMCRGCGWSALPRYISVEESVEYGRRGTEQAQSGNFEDAEFWFRRILGSWPGYGAGYADLGQLSLSRAEATRDADERAEHRKQAEKLFRKALASDGNFGGVRAPLARTLALLGKEAEAIELLRELDLDTAAGENWRAEGRALLEDIESGKALFSRASEQILQVVLQPPRQKLEPADRRRIEEAQALLQESNRRKSAFASEWLLGKCAMRLGNFTQAAESFERACAVNPQQPDGQRELASAYLELERNSDALAASERALAIKPQDATLHCNLAFVLVLTGDLERARQEATLAAEADPSDAITRHVLKLLDDIASGKRKRPQSIAEAEGRRG